MDTAQYIKKECYRMKEGERVTVERRMFQDAFTYGFPTIYWTPREAFLSSMIDSGRGTFRVSQNLETGNYTISRHKPENERYYVDPDRRHLFNKQADGTLVLKEDS